MNTNLLDFKNDILEIIGGHVKQDNLNKELKNDVQVLKGKRIRFPSLGYRHPYILYDENGDYIKDKDTITKDDIKRYLFNHVDFEIIYINCFAKTDKIRLGKDNITMCIWVCIKRCKLTLDNYKLN
jgi:hypothetical protein